MSDHLVYSALCGKGTVGEAGVDLKERSSVPRAHGTRTDTLIGRNADVHDQRSDGAEVPIVQPCEAEHLDHSNLGVSYPLHAMFVLSDGYQHM